MRIKTNYLFKMNIFVLTLLLFGCTAGKNTTVESAADHQTATSTHGTENHVSWASKVNWTSNNDTVTIEIIATIEDGWHLYSQHLESDQGPLATVFSFTPSANVILTSEVMEGKAKEEYDENFGMNVRFFEKSAVFTQKVVRKTAESVTLIGNVNYMVCNDEMCLPPIDVPLNINIGPK